MASSRRPDPIEVMEQFLNKIAPYDPSPDDTVMSMEMRIGRSRGSFQLTARAVRALTEMLAAYQDPDDCGACTNCGNPLNKDLHCVRCGHVDGVFGQVLAHHAADVARREGRGHGPVVARFELTESPEGPRRVSRHSRPAHARA